jgi:hypothetical protein
MTNQENRVCLVGPFQMVRAQAINEAVNVEPFVQYLPRLNVHGLWLESVIQAGADRIEVSPLVPRDRPKHVPSRVVERPLKRDALVLQMSGNLHSYLPPSAPDISRSTVAKIDRFLVELLLAGRWKRNLVLYEAVPNGIGIEKLLPADLAFPIKNLLKQITPVEGVVVASRHSISARDLKKFEDIFDSAVYRRYVHSQNMLEDPRLPKRTAIEEIARQSRKLSEKWDHLLRLRKTSLAVLSLTGPIVEATLGKLPAAIASLLTSGLRPLIENERRIVIYEHADILEETMTARMTELIAKMEND